MHFEGRMYNAIAVLSVLANKGFEIQKKYLGIGPKMNVSVDKMMFQCSPSNLNVL